MRMTLYTTIYSGVYTFLAVLVFITMTRVLGMCKLKTVFAVVTLSATLFLVFTLAFSDFGNHGNKIPPAELTSGTYPGKRSLNEFRLQDFLDNFSKKKTHNTSDTTNTSWSEYAGNHGNCSRHNLLEYFSHNLTGSYPDYVVPGFLTRGRYLCTPETHTLSDRDILVFVVSDMLFAAKRRLVRETWASQKTVRVLGENSPRNIAVIFVIGVPLFEQRNRDRLLWAKLLAKEIDVHRDVLLVNMVDTYDLLPLKGLAAMNWIVDNTPETLQFILKTDDDSYVNVIGWASLTSYITARPESPNRFIVGTSCPRKGKVGRKGVRSPLTFEEYNNTYFPPYCVGAGYLMSRDALTAIVSTSPSVRLVKKEDVYFAGLVAKEADVTLFSCGGLTNQSPGRPESPFLLIHHMSLLKKHWRAAAQLSRISRHHGVDSWARFCRQLPTSDRRNLS